MCEPATLALGKGLRNFSDHGLGIRVGKTPPNPPTCKGRGPCCSRSKSRSGEGIFLAAWALVSWRGAVQRTCHVVSASNVQSSDLFSVEAPQTKPDWLTAVGF